LSRPKFEQWYQCKEKLYGTIFANLRHESYFLLISSTSSISVLVRASLGAIRTLYWTMRGTKKARIENKRILFIATLDGSSGIGSLKPIMVLLRDREIDFALLCHPRLSNESDCAEKVNFYGISVSSVYTCLQETLGMLRSCSNDNWLDKFVIFSVAFRFQLWRAVIRQYVDVNNSVVVAHNDFDVFSAAAVSCVKQSVCIQHGIPTDEFFPTNANLQLVWGRQFVNLYSAKGVPEKKLAVWHALKKHRKTSDSLCELRPMVVNLVSQSHTNVYGIDFTPGLVSASISLLQVAEKENISFRVLLHPEEVRRDLQPYKGIQGSVYKPPHGVFADSAHVEIVVGFASTALIAAAQLGHLVIGIEAENISASIAAYRVTKPIITVPQVKLATTIHQLLNDREKRVEHINRQADWIDSLYGDSNSDMLVGLLDD
jgi:hypothetical protein